MCNNICLGLDNKGFVINVCKLCWRNIFDWFIIIDLGYDIIYEIVDVNEVYEVVEL